MKKDIQTKREQKNITLTGVPETMLQTVFARAQGNWENPVCA